MKQLSFIFLLPCFLFFSTNEKNISPFKKTSEVNQPCKLKKIFYNDILTQEYHYNNKNKLIRIDQFLDGKVKWFFSLNYDEQDRIAFSDYGFYYYFSDEYVKESGVENPVVSQLTRYIYHYNDSKDLQFNTFKVYSGRGSQTEPVEENLEYKDRFLCTYNSINQLVKIENIHKKRKEKKVKKKIWYELEYHNNNVTIIKSYMQKKGEDIVPYFIEQREYDSHSNLQFNSKDLMKYPGVISQNNLKYLKRRFPLESPKIQEEYKKNHEYDENGMLIKSSRNTIHPKNEFYDGTFTYEYTCE